ncbi:Amino acid transporter, transmembrane [Kalmanozyma brasiliensis GHG001]|uniref:Amino acid transporter n=1 Tax=Kalmanozyma brasiliensis (strain GHG001) TaxID=1365824 RepID=V5EL76_KALBG|nr:Amino acid transporter, transmembrane [Kalmanozyma brasiliensis GHG001]EST05785.1 Amino acid transporter, transmembrane [Kalmanozyma brasiliensis GHG001]
MAMSSSNLPQQGLRSGRESEEDAGLVSYEGDNASHRLDLPSYSTVAAERAPLQLKSTTSSKEAQFDADSDDIDEQDDVVAIQASQIGLRSHDDPLLTSVGSCSNHLPRRERGARRHSLIDRIPGQNRIRTSLDGLSHDLRAIRQSLGVPGWDGEGLPDWLKRGAGVFDGTVNMANSILGAGIVGLPYSMRESGFIAGLVLLVGLSFLTDWTIRLIVLNAKLSGRITYIEIMEHCFGHNGKAAVSIFQFAFGFGGMCAFCVVIGDTIPHVIKMVFPSLDGTFLANRQFVITFFTMTVSYPLSLYRNIEKLSKASAIALVSMVVIIIAVTVRGPAMPAELKGDPALRLSIVNVSNLVRSISVISFAFVCHHNSLLIYGSLKEPSMRKFGRVTHYSTIIAAAATITMSVAGYWSFEEKTLSNVLNNFPYDDITVNIARGLFGLNMLTTLPLECFVCREVLETYFFAGEFDQNRHLIFTSSLVVSAMFISLLTCDLGIVLELTGGLSATALAFIFPSICYLKLTSETGKRVPTADLSHLTGHGNSSSNLNANHGTIAHDDSQQHGEEEQEALIEQSNGSIDRGQNAIRANQYDGAEEEEPSSYDRLERMENGQRAAANGSARDSVDVDDVELPLRPGASVRFRPAAANRKWWQSTRPLSVACAIFGSVVLVISVWTAISDTASGKTGAVHQC